MPPVMATGGATRPTVRSLVLARLRTASQALGIAGRALTWPPYSHVFLVPDAPTWVLAEEMHELRGVARRLGVPVAAERRPVFVAQQSVFHASHFALLQQRTFEGRHRLGVAYFHGRPSPEQPEFHACFEVLRRQHDRLERIQVSHSQMRDVVLSSGIEPRKVHQIPIGINLNYFPLQSPASRAAARRALGVPDSGVVVGSFQKDGVGWGEGREPKLVKGPDILLQVLDALRRHVPELCVLLSGPARGYVKAGLEQLGVPYRHVFVADYTHMGELYQALDAYIVTSREEGGPKAVLESMASGVPLISTRVGQAMDLVQHEANGWLVDVGDVAGLTCWARHALEYRASLGPVLARARETAQANTYTAQLPLWREFFRGFVEAA